MYFDNKLHVTKEDANAKIERAVKKARWDGMLYGALGITVIATIIIGSIILAL